ncbi:hypothetical protein PUN28_016301 [Cardiocondyla obscurior]|uniref:Secreted protein n=1 Tax=Cardiocondyla obscurior TaxID=286306 RepID=A0AAW2EVQ6_9HYME
MRKRRFVLSLYITILGGTLCNRDSRASTYMHFCRLQSLAFSSIRRQPKRWLHTDEPLHLYAWKPRFRVGLSA